MSIGRGMVASIWRMGPSSKTERLTKWVATKGVELRNDVVIKVSENLIEGVVRKTTIHPAEGQFYPGSPICNGLLNMLVGFIDESQSLGPVPSMLQNGDITFVPLVASHSDWWGESDRNLESAKPTLGPKDRKGPLALAVAVEKGAARDPQVKLQTPRLVVVGNGEHLSDPGLRISPALRDLLVNSVNWLLSRDTLIDVPAKEKPMNDVNLSDGQIASLGLALILGLPSAVGLFGLYYIWWRHGRNLITLSIVILSVALALWAATLGLVHWTTPRSEDSAGEVKLQ